MKIIIFAVIFAVAGCGTIKETVTTQTQAQIIPAKIVHDTTTIPITLPITDVMKDSIGRWYLQNYCKGTATVDEDGLKAKINFYVSQRDALKNNLNEASDSLDAKNDLIVNMQTDLEAKEQTIKAITTTTKTESTPGQLWIIWASKLYWIGSFVFGAIASIVLLYIFKSKLGNITKLLT